MKDNNNFEYFKEESKPNALVRNLVNILPKSASILDLACWEWRNSIYLARKGYSVTSVDISKLDIEKLKNISEKENLKIKTEVSDIRDYLEWCNKFGVIICANLLHIFSKDEVKILVSTIKQKTMKDGLNIVISFVAKTKKEKEEFIDNEKFLFSKWELKSIYGSWNINYYDEDLWYIYKHWDVEHKHFLVRMVAKKI